MSSVLVATIDEVRDVVRDALAEGLGVRRHAYTVDEAAESLGVSAHTVRQLISGGHLRTLPHMGRSVRIPVASLDEFTSAGASTPAIPRAGVDGPSGAIGTDPSCGGSVSPLPSARGAVGKEGPASTARGGPTTPAA